MITTKIPERSAAQCVERCRRKQATWSALPISQRLVLVRKFRNLLADECDMLCAALEQDINKPAEETIAVASNASTSVTFTEMQKAAVLDALDQPLEPGANEIGAGLRALRSALSDEREH